MGEYKEYFWNAKEMNFSDNYTRVYHSYDDIEEDFGEIPRNISVRIVKFTSEEQK
jgi:hypothetical protein